MNPIRRMMEHYRTVVRWRRRLWGPRRPTWTEDFELLAEVLHLGSYWVSALPMSTRRKLMEVGRPPTPAIRATRFEHVSAGGVPCEWFRQEGSDPDRVLVYFHGGGYSLGSIDSHRDLICRIAGASGLTALGVNYRLAPEHRFPAQLEDATSVWRWLLVQGFAPERIALAGDSAGGGLALSLMISLRDCGESLPTGAALLSPWVDLVPRRGSYRRNERLDFVTRAAIRAHVRHFVRSDADLRDPLAAPIHAELEGLPPILVQLGGSESFLDDGLRFVERARKAGVDARVEVWTDMIHVFQLLTPLCAEADEATDKAGVFLRERTKAAHPAVEAPRLGHVTNE